MTRKLSHPRYEALKVAAADLIEDYELTYPLQPERIAQLLGVPVVIHPGALPAVAQFCGTDDGYTEAVPTIHGTGFRIHLNGVKPELRRRFTLTHEIAHIWLDHLRPGVRIGREAAEAEANFFAGYLLAPDVLALEWLPELTVAALVSTFRISSEAARIAYGRILRAASRERVSAAHDRRILEVAGRFGARAPVEVVRGLA